MMGQRLQCLSARLLLPYELQCACGTDGDAGGVQPGIKAVFALIAFDGFPFAGINPDQAMRAGPLACPAADARLFPYEDDPVALPADKRPFGAGFHTARLGALYAGSVAGMKHNPGLPVQRCGRFRACMFDDDRRRLFRGVLKAGAIDKQGSEGNARCAVMGRLADGFTGMAGDAAILINDKAVYAHSASPGCLASGDCLLMRRPRRGYGGTPFRDIHCCNERRIPTI